nr:hypothetical protein [Gluconacetobacter azotocaptans]
MNGLDRDQLEREEAEIVVTLTGTGEIPEADCLRPYRLRGLTRSCLIIASSTSSTPHPTDGLPCSTRAFTRRRRIETCPCLLASSGGRQAEACRNQDVVTSQRRRRLWQGWSQHRLGPGIYTAC